MRRTVISECAARVPHRWETCAARADHSFLSDMNPAETRAETALFSKAR